MTAKEHAEILRQAARIIAGMDTMTAETNAQMQWLLSLPPEQAQQMQGAWQSHSYGPDEMAANRAYQCAARVLSVIAAEYEKASSQT